MCLMIHYRERTKRLHGFGPPAGWARRRLIISGRWFYGDSALGCANPRWNRTVQPAAAEIRRRYFPPLPSVSEQQRVSTCFRGPKNVTGRAKEKTNARLIITTPRTFIDRRDVCVAAAALWFVKCDGSSHSWWVWWSWWCVCVGGGRTPPPGHLPQINAGCNSAAGPNGEHWLMLLPRINNAVWHVALGN